VTCEEPGTAGMGVVAFRGTLRASVLVGRRLCVCVAGMAAVGEASKSRRYGSNSNARATVSGFATRPILGRCVVGGVGVSGAAAGRICFLRGSGLLHSDGGSESD
jgi:hypothetical protein